MTTADTDGEQGTAGGGFTDGGAAGGGSTGGGGGGRQFGDIRIGSVRGSAVGFGDHNHVVNAPGGEAPCDPAYEELLEAVRQLAADLERMVPGPEVQALSNELATAQEEILRTGRAGVGRLARMRALLQDASVSIGMLASGVAVGQAVGALLGG
ncbi:hypothetical protein [Streptomyces sp. NPDC048636]|uniref:hypothetical protein n=1 Tax=Streptomyces sp. NPDC048636 TaxID=3155762 RepID=UPI00343A8A69